MLYNWICSASGISADGYFRIFTVVLGCAPRYCTRLFTVFIHYEMTHDYGEHFLSCICK